MIEIRCTKCGAVLEKSGERYVCPACGAQYEERRAEDGAAALAKLLDVQKQEAVANLRQQLWKAVHEEYIDGEEISRLAKGIKKYLPEDYFANFCEVACSGNGKRLNKFLNKTDVRAEAMFVWEVLDFVLHILREENLLAVNEFLTRAWEAEGDSEKYAQYNRRLAREAERVSRGVYNAELPRDVFVAYSSTDMEEVSELVEALEGAGLKCFVAARNLQHGMVQQYEEKLCTAMDRCTAVVFVSSEHSRRVTCDALRVELPYIRERDVAGAPAEYRNYYGRMPAKYKKPRVEYVIDPYGGKNGAESIVNEFFAGCERSSDVAEVVRRVLEYKTALPAAGRVKYCAACGAENLAKAKFCSECGGRGFFATREEYEESLRKAKEGERLAAEKQRAEQEAAALKAERERLAAEKQRAEEEAAAQKRERERLAAEKQRAEQEAAALKAELERLRRETAARAAEPARAAEAPVSPFKGIAPSPSPAEDFEIEGGVLVRYKGKGGDVVIPQGVTEIGKDAFWSNTKVTSVLFPEGVRKIGSEAFYRCGNLARVSFAKGTAEIGLRAFFGCASLEEVPLPSGLKRIGNSAFAECEKLRSVRFEEGLEEIGDSAFDLCVNLESIALPDSVRSLASCFNGCERLRAARLPDGIEYLADTLFNGCAQLSEVKLPASLRGIGDFVFSGCGKLAAIDIPAGVRSIGMGAFENGGIESITLPEGVDELPSAVFRNCSALAAVYLPRSAAFIASDAFEGCDKVKLYCQGEEPSAWPQGWNEALRDKVVWDAPASPKALPVQEGRGAPARKAGPGRPAEAPVPPSKGIAPSPSPAEDFGIKGSVLVKYKGKGGDVVIPQGVKKIGEKAFSGCEKLTSVIIPDGVTSIAPNAFSLCGNLTSIVIPRSVTNIGQLVFSFCGGLKSIIVEEGNTVYHSAGNCLIKTASRTLIAGCQSSEIPADGSVTSIGTSAFNGCNSLKSIVIPKGVTSIGGGAFRHCTGLADVSIPDGVTSIGDSAFLGCNGLRKVVIPGSVTSIGDFAFQGGILLRSVEIKGRETSIGWLAFQSCCNLTGITLQDILPELKNDILDGCDRAKIYCRSKKPLLWPKGWDRSLKKRVIWDED